ncbi:hypothetical protein ACFX12_017908 [Malus domestica]
MFLENGGGWLRGSVLMHSTLILKSTGQTGCDAMTLTGVNGGAVLLMLCSPFSFTLWANETQKTGYQRDGSRGINDKEDGEACRKKLRLSKDQSAISATSSPTPPHQ